MGQSPPPLIPYERQLSTEMVIERANIQTKAGSARLIRHPDGQTNIVRRAPLSTLLNRDDDLTA